MPDAPRELIFPTGISVSVSHVKGDGTIVATQDKPIVQSELNAGREAESTPAEGGLDSEAIAIEQQARKVEPLKENENLLKAAPATVVESPVRGKTPIADRIL